MSFQRGAPAYPRPRAESPAFVASPNPHKSRSRHDSCGRAGRQSFLSFPATPALKIDWISAAVNESCRATPRRSNRENIDHQRAARGKFVFPH